MRELVDLYFSYMRASLTGMLVTGIISLLYGLVASGHIVELVLILFIAYILLRSEKKRIMERGAELEQTRMANRETEEPPERKLELK